MKDLKFLLHLVFVICVSASVFGQATKESIKKRMWESGDPDFEITEVPEKWKDESAVILCESNDFEYSWNHKASKINKDYYGRIRIKILNKSVLDKYSEFAFSEVRKKNSKSGDDVFFGMKIIKPDNTEIEVNFEDAVQMQKYKNSKEKRVIDEGYKKLAIPELEIGDIIDYYKVSINSFLAEYLERYEFEPVITTLRDEYPIINGKIGFLLEERCSINLSVFNGVPKPTRKIRNDKDYFVVEYKDLEKTKTELWTYPYRQEPTVKSQIVMVRPSSLHDENNDKSHPATLNTLINYNEYLRLINKMTSYSESIHTIKKNATKFIARQRISEDPETLMEDLFYFFRHYLYFNYSYNYRFDQLTTKCFFYDRFDFIQTFSVFLTDNNIDHFVFLGVPRHIGTIDSVVFQKELIPGIKLNVDDKPIYVYKPDINSFFGEGDYTMEGTKIIGIRNDENNSSASLIYDSIPLSQCMDNLQYDSIYVSFDSIQQNILQLYYQCSSSGSFKEIYDNMVITTDDYFRNEYKEYSNIKKTKYKDIIEKEDNFNRISKRIDKDNEFRNDTIKEMMKQKYDVNDLEIDTFNLLQQGRFKETSDIVFSCEVALPELVRDAGSYLIVDAGKLIGKNIDLNPKEKDREKDIYMPAPRKYDWIVNIEIPKGYTIEKADNFNFSVENSTGGFMSEAIIGVKYVTLKASKYYLHNYEPIDKWPEMLEFLEAANDFVQQKMVFIKKEE